MLSIMDMHAMNTGKEQVSILLVEDYEPNVMVARTILEDEGYAVDVASDGKEALEKTANTHYDLVLMDVQMPDLDGLETTRLLRSREGKAGTPPIPVIGMTAHVLQGDREKCLDAGMNDYVPKPFHVDMLLKIITRHVQETQPN